MEGAREKEEATNKDVDRNQSRKKKNGEEDRRRSLSRIDNRIKRLSILPVQIRTDRRGLSRVHRLDFRGDRGIGGKVFTFTGFFRTESEPGSPGEYSGSIHLQIGQG